MARSSYAIDLVCQDYPMGCWRASYKMMKSWATGSCVTDDPSYDDGWIGPNGGLNTDRDTISNFCANNGFTFSYIGGNPEAAVGKLKSMITRGPIMICGKVPAAHYYVITGMDTDTEYADTTVDMNDPLPVNVGATYSGRAVSKLVGSFPQAFYWAIQNA